MNRRPALLLSLLGTLMIAMTAPPAHAVEKMTFEGCADISMSPDLPATARQGETVTFVFTNAPTSACDYRTRIVLNPNSRAVTPQVTLGETRTVSSTVLEQDVRVGSDAWTLEKVKVWVTVQAEVQPASPDGWFGVEGTHDTQHLDVVDGHDGADLTVDTFSVEVDPRVFGDQIRYAFEIANRGDADAEEATTVDIKLNSGSYQEVRVCTTADLNTPGRCDGEEFLDVAPGAGQRLEVCVNRRGFMREQTLANNCSVRVFDVPDDLPDLGVLHIVPFLLRVDPPPVVNQPSTIYANVENSGTAAAPAFNILVERPSGSVTIPVAGLARNGRFDLALAWTPTHEGPAVIRVTADPEGAIDELFDHTANNSSSLNVQVAPEPERLSDLLILPGGISMTPAAPQGGDTIVFTVRVTNNEPNPTPAQTPERLLVEDGLNSANLECSEPIAAFGECVKLYNTTAVPGNQLLRVTADPNGAIDEVDEDNNERALSYNVPIDGTELTCQGIWHLSGVVEASAPGSVVDACDVYWAQNTPSSTCWETSGIGDLITVWHRDNGSQCPNRATVFYPTGEQAEFTVTIE